MPFFKSARIELLAREGISVMTWSVALQPFKDPPATSAIFTRLIATFRNPNAAGTWCCSTQRKPKAAVIGPATSSAPHSFLPTGQLHTLEGDPRFFFDDSLTPQGQGTGSEEWGGGGDYWGGEHDAPLRRPPGRGPIVRPNETTTKSTRPTDSC